MNVLNTRQLADMLGVSIERVRGIGRRRDLPSVRIGGRYYFDRDTIMDHIAHTKGKSHMKRENEQLREKVQQLENKLESIKNHFWDVAP